MPLNEQLTPTYHGYILSNEDALYVVQAALSNRLPLVKRRPLDSERPELIRLGNVFVFIEESSEIKRWTDGVAWSASRILGRFLIYRKLDKNAVMSKDDKRKVKITAAKRNSLNDMQHPEVSLPIGGSAHPQDSRSADLYSHYDNIDTPYDQSRASPSVSSSRGLSPQAHLPVSQDRGLLKKTLSLKIAPDPNEDRPQQTVHLISYFCAHDVILGNLIRPSQTFLKETPITSSVWLAMKRSSLGGKLLSENEANFYLDTNFQLQNMSSFLVNDDRQLRVITREVRAHLSSDHSQRYSPALPLDPSRPAPLSAPVTGLVKPSYGLHTGAPLRSPVFGSVGSDNQILHDTTHTPFSYGSSDGYPHVETPSLDEQPRKRSKSLQTDTHLPRHISAEPATTEDPHTRYVAKGTYDMMQGYVPQLLHHPNFGGGIRSFRPDMPLPLNIGGPHAWDANNHYGSEVVRGLASAPPLYSTGEETTEHGYEQFSALGTIPTLNNRAFGVQVSHQAQNRPHASISPQYTALPYPRWDLFPLAVHFSAPVGPENHHEEIDNDQREIYE